MWDSIMFTSLFNYHFLIMFHGHLICSMCVCGWVYVVLSPCAVCVLDDIFLDLVVKFPGDLPCAGSIKLENNATLR